MLSEKDHAEASLKSLGINRFSVLHYKPVWHEQFRSNKDKSGSIAAEKKPIGKNNGGDDLSVTISFEYGLEIDCTSLGIDRVYQNTFSCNQSISEMRDIEFERI